MKYWLFFLAMVLAGCGKSVSGVKSNAFDNAQAPVKEVWVQAVACAQTNDYAGAAIRMMGLRNERLTPEQAAAVESAMKTVTEAMYQAADRGDAAALKAVEELKRRPRRP
jgi:hypothetical protein